MTAIRCHDDERAHSQQWWEAHGSDVPEPQWTDRDGHRHCTWCDSIHPLDLLAALTDAPAVPAALLDCDWKYGWPHKFRVRLPGGLTVVYNAHLRDLPEADFVAVAALISRHTGVEFLRDDTGRLCFTTALIAPGP